MLPTLGWALSFLTHLARHGQPHSSKPGSGTRKIIPPIMQLLQHRVTIHDHGKERFPAAFPCSQSYMVLNEADFHLIPQAHTL